MFIGVVSKGTMAGFHAPMHKVLLCLSHTLRKTKPSKLSILHAVGELSTKMGDTGWWQYHVDQTGSKLPDYILHKGDYLLLHHFGFSASSRPLVSMSIGGHPEASITRDMVLDRVRVCVPPLDQTLEYWGVVRELILGVYNHGGTVMDDKGTYERAMPVDNLVLLPELIEFLTEESLWLY